MAILIRVDDTLLRVRPIEITDVDRLTCLFERLSAESIYYRFFSPLPQVPRSMILHLAAMNDRDRASLVALAGDEIVAVASYGPDTGGYASPDQNAEIAVVVDDAWQRRGIGRHLTRRLATVALDHGYEAFVARILPSNRAALALVRALARDATVAFADGEFMARLPLTTVAAAWRRVEPREDRVRRSA